jgi:UPF0755 protein
MPRRRLKRRRRLFRLAFALLLLAAAAAAACAAYLFVVYPRQPGPGRGDEVVLDVPWSATAEQTARRAAARGVVAGWRRFALYLRATGAARRLQAGRHEVRDDWTAAEVAAALTRSGRARQVRVTLREGESRLDLADELDRLGVVDRERFLASTEDPALLAELGIPAATAEGYLYPETYLMAPATQAETVVRRLVATFRDRTRELLGRRAAAVSALEADMAALEASLAEARARHGEQGRQREVSGLEAVVILASIVEAETPHADERPLVAAAYLNRLRSPSFPLRRLQADPTVSYGCRLEPAAAPSCRGFSGALGRPQLEDRANRYNTYVSPGLPPGPIGNPSLESIRAVLEPARVEVFYFVAGPDGRHTFSATLAEHRAAVERAREGEREREGEGATEAR